MPFKYLRKKWKVEPVNAYSAHYKATDNKSPDEHFEEISLDSRKRKDTTATASDKGEKRHPVEKKEEPKRWKIAGPTICNFSEEKNKSEKLGVRPSYMGYK
jgi:Ni,Fe-hydrogenase III large subunit